MDKTNTSIHRSRHKDKFHTLHGLVVDEADSELLLHCFHALLRVVGVGVVVGAERGGRGFGCRGIGFRTLVGIRRAGSENM
jgi:hypothetical protein